MAERSYISTHDINYTIYTPKHVRNQIYNKKQSQKTKIENTRNYPFFLQKNYTTAVRDTIERNAENIQNFLHQLQASNQLHDM